MRPIAANATTLLFGGSLVLLSGIGGGASLAHDCTGDERCQLFDETPAFPTGETRPITDAESFGEQTRRVFFDPDHQTAHIAGGPDPDSPFVVDNFLTINGSCEGAVNNICAHLPGQSCFASIRRPDVERLVRDEQNDRDIFITEILNEVRPVDVSHLLPQGRTEVRFNLCDFGRIAGNTDLFLVIRDRPQCSASQCVADAHSAHAQALNQCAQVADACGAAGGFDCFEEQQLCVTRADEDLQRDLDGSCAQCTQ